MLHRIVGILAVGTITVLGCKVDQDVGYDPDSGALEGSGGTTGVGGNSGGPGKTDAGGTTGGGTGGVPNKTDAGAGGTEEGGTGGSPSETDGGAGSGGSGYGGSSTGGTAGGPGGGGSSVGGTAGVGGAEPELTDCCQDCHGRPWTSSGPLFVDDTRAYYFTESFFEFADKDGANPAHSYTTFPFDPGGAAVDDNFIFLIGLLDPVSRRHGLVRYNKDGFGGVAIEAWDGDDYPHLGMPNEFSREIRLGTHPWLGVQAIYWYANGRAEDDPEAWGCVHASTEGGEPLNPPIAKYCGQHIQAMVEHNGVMYWSEKQSSGGIFSGVAWGGTGYAAQLSSDFASVLAVDDSRLYYATPQAVRAMSFDGSSAEDVMPGITATALVIDGDRLLVAGTDGRLLSVPRAGGAPVEIASCTSGAVTAIATDESYVYWITTASYQSQYPGPSWFWRKAR